MTIKKLKRKKAVVRAQKGKYTETKGETLDRSQRNGNKPKQKMQGHSFSLDNKITVSLPSTEKMWALLKALIQQNLFFLKVFMKACRAVAPLLSLGVGQMRKKCMQCSMKTVSIHLGGPHGSV